MIAEAKKRDITDIINILMQLDKNSLLLIESGARLLAARQDMDKENTGKDEMLAL